jgi:DNA-binding transcriptional LysR family regulator
MDGIDHLRRWDMDGRQLAVFAAVARTGSFTRGAAEMHVVQSAVSATVAGLEAELGVRLFDRSTRRVQLTEAGHALLPHAAAVVDAFQAARDAVEAVRGGLSGSVSMGYLTNLTLFDVPALLGRFAADYPAVRITLTPSDTGTGGLVEGLRRGYLDLAFLAAVPAQYPDLHLDLLATAPVDLVVAASSPYAGLDQVTLAETADMRFVDFRVGFGNRTVADAEFARRRLQREVVIETSDHRDAMALVRNGLGVAFLPRRDAEADPLLHCVELADADLDLHISLGTPRDRPLGAAATRLAARVLQQAAEGSRRDPAVAPDGAG